MGRKLSVVDEQKSKEVELPKQETSIDVPQTPSLIQQSSSSLASLPASISTQTLPVQEFPEVSVSCNTVINQSTDVDEITNQSQITNASVVEASTAQHDVPLPPQKSSTHEMDRKGKGIKKTRSRSIEEKEKRMTSCGSDDGSKIEDVCQDNAGGSSFDEQQQQQLSQQQQQAQQTCCKQSFLTHQPSLASQDEDFEIALVSGLLPGCVGKIGIP